MRELLTGLAIVLIVVLTAALVAPYVIDWTGQRAFIEARLTQVLGQRVTIGGAIDIKLLPTPYLVLGQTVIGNDDSPIRLSIHHLDLELSLTPLLHGEFDVSEARLVEPTIRVALASDRTLPALPDAPAFKADVALDHIAVTDGTLAIADPLSGRTFALQNLDVEADAASLSGPFKVAGTEGPDGHPTSFRLSTTQAHDGRAHVRLVVAGNADHASLDLDGTLALSAAGRSTVRQSFEGNVTIAGKLDQAAGAPVAWTLAGPLKADPARAALDGGELRLGGEDEALTLAASGTADLGQAPHIDLDLSAKTLDLDRLSGAPADPSKPPPPPPQLPPLATIERAIAAATPPLPAAVIAEVDTATWGGETLSDLAAHIAVGSPGAEPFSLSGDGPGGARLEVDGRLAPTGFAGKVALSATNPARTAAWLAAVDPSSPIKAGDLPASALSASAAITVGTGTIDAKAIVLAIGASKLTGSAQVETPDHGPAKLTAALSSPALHLDALPDIAAWRRPGGGVDLDLSLEAGSLEIAEAGRGLLTTGPLRLAMTKTGSHATLRSFTADNLGGARIVARGSLAPDAAHLSLTLDAAKLEAAAKLAQQLVPGDLADGLAARAAALAPAKLTLDTDWGASGTGGLVATRGTLDGTLGRTGIHAGLAPDAASSRTITLDATLKAPEGSALLRQLGVAALPIDRLGASQLTLAAHGVATAPLDTKMTAVIGDTRVDVAGRFKLLAAPRGGSGMMTFASPDVAPLLRSTALAFPDLTARLPVKATGALAYGTAGLGLTDLDADIAGAKLSGTLRVAPETGDAPAVTGALSLDSLSLGTLFALALGPAQPAAPDSVWSDLAFAGSLAEPPRTAVQLQVASLALADGIEASKASADLVLAPDQLRLDHVAAELDGGKLGGSLILRRDGAQAGMEASLDLDGVRLDLPAASGVLSGRLGLAGTGSTPLGLVSSLAGSGTATIANLSIAQADAAELPKLFAAVEADELSVDAETVARSYGDAAKAPLALGRRSYDLALAGGTLAFAPKTEDASSRSVRSTLDAALDLRVPKLSLRVKETLLALPAGWSGAPPSLVVAWNGPPRAPSRSIDVSAFINAVAARALMRETARIETYEQDIRERALFNTRLQSERRRAQDKAKAEADAREAKARREAAVRAAQEKTDRDRAAQPADEPPAGPPAQPAPAAGPREFEPAQPGAGNDPSAAGRY